ncbi:hypothetical protein ACJX0J_038301 [Zea mays]
MLHWHCHLLDQIIFSGKLSRDVNSLKVLIILILKMAFTIIDTSLVEGEIQILQEDYGRVKAVKNNALNSLTNYGQNERMSVRLMQPGAKLQEPILSFFFYFAGIIMIGGIESSLD